MPYSAKQVSVLQSERTNDPIVRGYAGMTNAQFLASVTAFDRENIAPVGALFNYLVKETARDHSSETAPTHIYGRLRRIDDAGSAAIGTKVFCTNPACSTLTGAGLDACRTLLQIADQDRLSVVQGGGENYAMTEAKFVSMLQEVKDAGVMKPADVTAIQALSQNLRSRVMELGLPKPTPTDVGRTS